MYEIDGVPLEDPQRRWGIESQTQARTPVAFRVVDAAVPGVDGSLPVWGEDVEATALGLELNVWGTPQEVERSCGFLRGLLGKTYAPLIVKRSDGLTAEAKPAAISEPIMMPRYALISATLTIPSGVWRGPVETWQAGTLVGDHDVATLEDGTRAVTDALVLVTGPATALRITDEATGSVLSHTGSVPAGQRLLVDLGQWRAALGTSVSWGSTSGNATRDVDGTGPRSASHLWSLTPQATPAGVTRTRISVSATGTTNASGLQIRARSSHL